MRRGRRDPELRNPVVRWTSGVWRFMSPTGACDCLREMRVPGRAWLESPSTYVRFMVESRSRN